MSAVIAHARRDGFTLIELLIVTVVLGILFLLAAPKVAEMRESAFVVAAKTEIRSAGQSIQMYRIVHGTYPDAPADLKTIGYITSEDIEYCTFEYVSGGGGDRDDGAESSEDYFLIVAKHRGSHSLVTTHYPSWNGRMEVTTIESEGCPHD